MMNDDNNNNGSNTFSLESQSTFFFSFLFFVCLYQSHLLLPLFPLLFKALKVWVDLLLCEKPLLDKSGSQLKQ